MTSPRFGEITKVGPGRETGAPYQTGDVEQIAFSENEAKTTAFLQRPTLTWLFLARSTLTTIISSQMPLYGFLGQVQFALGYWVSFRIRAITTSGKFIRRMRS
jgi:hypothetical protein